MVALMAVLIIMNFILVFAFSAGAQSGPPRDPFLSYADLLSKSQALTALEDQKFSCQYVLQEISKKCSIRPKDGLFSEINVTVVRGVPESVVFKVVKNRLQVGDLALLWGKPDRITPQYLFWPERNDVTMSAHVASSDRLNYRALVWDVSFNL